MASDMGTSADQKHLRKHGRQWHVIKAVPRAARGILGCSQLKETLKTDSLLRAQRDRWPVLARMQNAIDAALHQASRQTAPTSLDPLLRDALEWRDYTTKDERLFSRQGNESIVVAAEYASLVEDEARQKALEHGLPAARDWQGVVTGTATPLMLHREQWLRELAVKPRTRLEYKKSTSLLEAWAAEHRHRTVESITRSEAGRFISDVLIAQGKAPQTVSKRVTALRVYWDWLSERGHLSADADNPWNKHKTISRAAKRATAGRRPKRAFTDSEMMKLFYSGTPDETLRDYMMIAALSGMRISEIGALTVGDCADGLFNIRASKSDAGVRKIPIHVDLRKLIARLSRGRKPGDWLIIDRMETDRLGAYERPRGETWDRSRPISKRFTRFRQTVGVHDQAADKRYSAVDFHSFRRWFITKAGRAGITFEVIQQAVGHAPQGVTHDYFDGHTLAQLQRCVRAVKLPAKPKG